MTATPEPLDLEGCSVLELIQHANRHRIAFHLQDDRLIIHPSRTSQHIADAMLVRGDEVVDFMRAHGRQWRTPPEEEEYRHTMADEMCMEMFHLSWDTLVALTIDRLAETVGEAWERHCARLSPIPPRWDDDLVHDVVKPTPITVLPTAHAAGRRSFRREGRNG